MAGHVIRLRQRGPEPFGYLEGDLVGAVGQECDELIPTEAGDHVALADIARQARCCLDQKLVTHRVAEGVVDVLEAVEVHEQHGDMSARRPRERELDPT